MADALTTLKRVRTMFALYLILIVAGIALYSAIGATHR